MTKRKYHGNSDLQSPYQQILMICTHKTICLSITWTLQCIFKKYINENICKITLNLQFGKDNMKKSNLFLTN